MMQSDRTPNVEGVFEEQLKQMYFAVFSFEGMLKSDRWFLNFVILSGEKVTNYSLLVVFAFLVVYKTKSKGCLPKKVLSNLPSSVSRGVVTRACLVSAAHEPKDASPALCTHNRASTVLTRAWPGIPQN